MVTSRHRRMNPELDKAVKQVQDRLREIYGLEVHHTTAQGAVGRMFRDRNMLERMRFEKKKGRKKFRTEITFR